MGGFLGGDGGITLGCGLVIFLRGHHSLIVERLNTGVGLLGYLDAGLSLLPHIESALYLLLPRAVLRLLALGLRSLLGGLRLLQLGLHIRGIEDHQSISGLHRIALLDEKFDDARCHLGRYPVVVHVRLPFDILRRRPQ